MSRTHAIALQTMLDQASHASAVRERLQNDTDGSKLAVFQQKVRAAQVMLGACVAIRMRPLEFSGLMRDIALDHQAITAIGQ